MPVVNFKKLLGRDSVPASRPPQNGPRRPVFVSSVMKSGTWLLRAVLEALTGLSAREPLIGSGTPDYDNEMLIEIPPGTFFSWHSVLNERSNALLKGTATKNIFLVRNIYDLIVSMYNHLRRDPDAAIGRSIGGSGYLADLPPENGISMVIAGFTTPQLTWTGIAPHIRHIASLLHFLEDGGDALILSYEDLVRDKAGAVRRIAQYLEMPVDDERVAKVVEATDFEAMKAAARESGTDGHFTAEKDRQTKRFVQPYHIAMVNGITMQEMPDLAGRLARIGMPWLFDYYGVDGQ